jgi:putative hemolysin
MFKSMGTVAEETDIKLGATAEDNLIHLSRHCQHPLSRLAAVLATRVMERPLRFREINAHYAELIRARQGEAPFGRILGLLEMTYMITSGDLARLSDRGPLVVIANHPFGGIEGIILGDLLQRIRPDVKILGNYLLERIAPIRESIISIDPFGRRSSVSANAAGLRACLRWLKAGNCLIAFPAGEVSHYCHRQQRITDPPWSSHIAALVRRSGARVLPVFFPGRNSVLFNLMGFLHPRLRTVMLPRELLSRQGSRVRLFIGSPIPSDRTRNFEHDRALIRWLRFKTYFLANRMENDDPSDVFQKNRLQRVNTTQALIEPVPKELLAAEVGALDKNSRLVTHKHLTVFVAGSERIPHLLREIGRLREITFREVGEGTGKSMDADIFDSYYHHLVLWNAERAEVVGAYRMGDTRDILNRFGRNGLYTHSLFRFKNGLFRNLAASLELGRSFICSEYQRQPNCLALLWKGIGAYVVRHPEYRILFGPVSISNSYHRVSKNIMVQFLQRSCQSRELSAYVSPRRPFRSSSGRGGLRDLDDRLPTGSIDDISMLISEIESDGKQVPVLIKHYLKLNGQFIAFNVDHAFSDAIDGLVVVDLMNTDTKLLDRFMGMQGRRDYREYWSEADKGCRLR